MSERFPIGELSHLTKNSSMPLVHMVHIRKVSCSYGHVFVAKHNKHIHILNPSRKHTLGSFRVIERVEKAADRVSQEKSV